jgi:hypothetical protein
MTSVVHDLRAMHAAWSSRPLVQVTTPRASGGDPLVALGHALLDEFVPAGRDVDAALDAAVELSRSSRGLLHADEPAHRGVGVLQARSGELYLTGLNSEPFLPNDPTRALELRDGVVARAGLRGVLRPGFESNQLTAPDIYLGPPGAAFDTPRFEKLVDELIAVAGPSGATRL